MTVPGVVFVPNPRFDEELVRSTGVRDVLQNAAGAAAELYRDGVPRHEGDLAESIFGVVALLESGYVGRVGATDWKAALIEFGTSKRAPDGSLRRAVEATGLTLETTRPVEG